MRARAAKGFSQEGFRDPEHRARRAPFFPKAPGDRADFARFSGPHRAGRSRSGRCSGRTSHRPHSAPVRIPAALPPASCAGPHGGLARAAHASPHLAWLGRPLPAARIVPRRQSSAAVSANWTPPRGPPPARLHRRQHQLKKHHRHLLRRILLSWLQGGWLVRAAARLLGWRRRMVWSRGCCGVLFSLMAYSLVERPPVV